MGVLNLEFKTGHQIETNEKAMHLPSFNATPFMNRLIHPQSIGKTLPILCSIAGFSLLGCRFRWRLQQCHPTKFAYLGFHTQPNAHCSELVIPESSVSVIVKFTKLNSPILPAQDCPIPVALAKSRVSSLRFLVP
jgi:hypothetical protein